MDILITLLFLLVIYAYLSHRKIKSLVEQLDETTNSNNDDDNDNSFELCTIEIYSDNGTLIKKLHDEFKFEEFDDHSISVVTKKGECYDIVTTGTIIVIS